MQAARVQCAPGMGESVAPTPAWTAIAPLKWKREQMSKKRIFVILGMHRSGTSAMARGLKALSIELGDNLLPPVEGNNDRGFWEDRDIYRLNERLLAKSGSGWDRLASIDEPLLLNDAFAAERREAAVLLDGKTSRAPFFGFKDPRTSVLLPFWKCVFEDLGLEQSYIVAVRNPFEVAESLHKRDKLDTTLGLGLWLKYSWSAILNSAGKPRIAVSYSRLMEDPGGELGRLADAFGLRRPSPASPEFIEYVGEFLSTDLRHNRVSDNEVYRAQTIPPPIPDLYQRLQQWSERPPGEDLEIPPRLKTRIETYLSQSQSMLALGDRLKQTADAQTAKAVAAEKSRQELKVYAEQLQARVADKDKSIASLRQSEEDTKRLYADTRNTGEVLAAKLDAAEQRLADAQAKLQERDQTLASLKQAQLAADQKLADAQAKLQERESELGAVRNESDANSIRLKAALESEVSLREQAQAEARRYGSLVKLSESEWNTKHKTELANKVSQATSQISAEYSQVIERLKGELAEQSAAARLLKQEVLQLRSSTSWRITRPARAIASRFGSFGSSLKKSGASDRQQLSSPEQ